MEKGIGLITPTRSKEVINKRFAAAYGFAENAKEIFLANPTRDKIKIKKGSKVAEFHPRSKSAYKILQCGGIRDGVVDRWGGNEREGGLHEGMQRGIRAEGGCGQRSYECAEGTAIHRSQSDKNGNPNNNNRNNSGSCSCSSCSSSTCVNEPKGGHSKPDCRVVSDAHEGCAKGSEDNWSQQSQSSPPSVLCLQHS